MSALRRATILVLSTLLTMGGAVVMAPAASATGARCTYDLVDYNAEVDGDGINYRTGPSTAYSSRGLLYNRDKLRVYCGAGKWYYTKLRRASGGGLPTNTHGWVHSDMLLQLPG